MYCIIYTKITQCYLIKVIFDILLDESLYIRQLKPTLNAHEKSILLHLF